MTLTRQAAGDVAPDTSAETSDEEAPEEAPVAEPDPIDAEAEVALNVHAIDGRRRVVEGDLVAQREERAQPLGGQRTVSVRAQQPVLVLLADVPGPAHGVAQALGALEQGGESELTEPLALLGREVMIEEGREFIEEQAGEFLAHGDAPPQRGLGLEGGAQLGESDQEDLHPPGGLEVALGQGAGLGEGFLGQFVGRKVTDPLRLEEDIDGVTRATVTATAVMTSWEDGLLELDEDVSTYLASRDSVHRLLLNLCIAGL